MPRPAPLEDDRQALAFFRRYVEEHGRSPTIAEVGAAIGLAHPNHAKRNLDRLVAAGELARAEGIARGYYLPDGNSRASLRVLGTVFAGRPMPVSDPDHDDLFNFEDEFCRDGMFGLRVTGTSMIEDHIAPGDLVVVRTQPEAAIGDEVVARVDGEMTLKIYREVRGVKWLFPCNAKVEPIRLDQHPDSSIIGVLVGVIRSKRHPRRR
jgi:repressor LexA